MAVTDAPTRPRGNIGQDPNPWAATVQDILEHVPDLIWPTSVLTYARMRHDPVLKSILAAYVHPIVRARWSIDPRGASGRVVQLAADSLGLPVLGRPDDPGPWRRRGVRWTDHLKIAAPTVLTFGHAPFEHWWDVTTGRAVLAGLGERLPVSLMDINTHTDGSLKDIVQKSVTLTPGQPIPAAQLVWYAHDREGAAWQGQSMLRHAFGPWLIKQDMLRVHATSLRRFGSGTPVMEALPGFTPTAAQQTAAENAARSIRVGDTGGAATVGYRLRIVGVEGTLPDALPFLAYLDQQMARGALASVLDLGNTAHGTRALGQTFAELLGMAQESIAEQIADTATGGLLVPLTDFNDGVTANAPALSVTVSRRAVAESMAALIQAGGLQMDASLQAWMRDALDLPEPDPVAAPTVIPVPGIPAEPGQAAPGGVDNLVAAAAGDWPYRRALTAKESSAGLDPQAVDAAHAAALKAVMDAWPDIAGGWRDQLVAQITTALAVSAVDQLGYLNLDTTDAAEVLAVGMSEAADAGALIAAAEASSQGHTVPDGTTADPQAVAGMAGVVAAVMGSAFSAAAAREAVRLVGASGARADDVAGQVGGFLDALSGTYPQDVLSGAISDGINAGREAVFRGSPEGTVWLASEVRDSHSCAPCTSMDGTEWDTLDDALAEYPGSGYVGCQGRERCRGLLLAVYS